MESTILALTQGDPAGIGPEILLKSAGARTDGSATRLLLIAERAALEAVAGLVPGFPWDRLVEVHSPGRAALTQLGGLSGADANTRCFRRRSRSDRARPTRARSR